MRRSAAVSCLLGSALVVSMTARAAEWPQAVAKAIQERETFCRQQGGQLHLSERFTLSADLDGDGRSDALMDDAEARCSQGEPGWCGSGGCTVSVFMAKPDGSMKQVIRQVSEGYALADADKGKTLALPQHNMPALVFRFESGCAVRDKPAKRTC